MKISTAIWMLASGAVWLVGCSAPTHQMEMRAGGKVYLTAYQGDVVKWKPAADFPNHSPCKGHVGSPQKGVSSCTIDAPNNGALYTYTCAGCSDPAIKVGTNVVLQGDSGTATNLTTASQPAPINCDNNKKAIADPVSAPASNDGLSSNVSWYVDGESDTTPFTVSTFTLKGSASSPCAEDTQMPKIPINETHPYCTLNKGSAGVYQYQLTAKTCTGGVGTATLTVY